MKSSRHKHGDHHHDHDHDHAGSEHHHHDHHHDHGSGHHHHDQRARRRAQGEALVVIRPNSGLSGDIMVAGLLTLAGLDQDGLSALLTDLGLAELCGRVRLTTRSLNEVNGVGLEVDLPPEHRHRALKDMEEFFGRSAISDEGKALALKTFRLLAEAEGAVHGRPPEEVHFHEVGALDSIMDIGLAAELLARLAPAGVICGPLPVCDGVINCQHGLLPAPAPAVLRLLEGVPVVGLASQGETVTPTAIALLKGCGAQFGPWPPMVVERQCIAYGSRVLEGVPNGAVFVFGRSHEL